MTKQEKEPKRETPPEFLASTAAVLVVGLFIIGFCMQAFAIPSGSMEQTLLIGDHVFVDRATIAPITSWMPLLAHSTVHRGDILVFLSPAEPGKYLVKRIVGVPGDHIRLENGVLFVNGKRQLEPYVLRNGTFNAYRDNFPNAVAVDDPNLSLDWHLTMRQYIADHEIVVPPNHYFGMGDNRDVSLDSRYWGFIPQENIIGRPMFVYWSFPTPREEDLVTARQRLAFTMDEVVHFFDETRWRRMLHSIR